MSLEIQSFAQDLMLVNEITLISNNALWLTRRPTCEGKNSGKIRIDVLDMKWSRGLSLNFVYKHPMRDLANRLEPHAPQLTDHIGQEELWFHKPDHTIDFLDRHPGLNQDDSRTHRQDSQDRSIKPWPEMVDQENGVTGIYPGPSDQALRAPTHFDELGKRDGFLMRKRNRHGRRSALGRKISGSLYEEFNAIHNLGAFF
jgi:hypothetical protein